MPNIYKTPWAIALDELLSDGQWHDGLRAVREAEKKITPGVAERRAESDRARMSSKLHGEARPRKRELGTATLIRIGKRAVMRSLVAARVRDGVYELDPHPLPDGAYRIGGWKVRDVRANRKSVSEIAREYSVTPRTLARLVADSDIPRETVGRITYISKTDLDQIAALVQTHREATAQRRIEASRIAAQRRRQAPVTRKSLSDLAEQSHLSNHSARCIADTNPDLPWETVGRITYLPLSALPLWQEAVNAWEATRHDRRSMGSTKGFATRRRRKQDQQDGQREP